MLESLFDGEDDFLVLLNIFDMIRRRVEIKGTRSPVNLTTDLNPITAFFDHIGRSPAEGILVLQILFHVAGPVLGLVENELFLEKRPLLFFVEGAEALAIRNGN